MALADSASTVAAKFANLSIARQIGLLVGVAASIAIGLAVVLWSRDPNYVPLYTQMNARDAAEVVSALERNGIDFKIDNSNSMIMVAADNLQNARLKLAMEGLPRDPVGSEELFSNANAFNSSQFMENARYKQALEAELARTISKFNDIKSARVHLAIPRESAFVRDAHEPSASVFLDVYSGLELKKHTIAAIVNLVASSIPNLSASRVTVVDQDGQLLNEGGGQTFFTDTERYLDYRQNLEHQYAQKIQDILTPILGYGRVRAKVSADIDFTSYEQTQEMFNPELPSLRSEQTMEEKRSSSSDAVGVPGTLSNTPQSNPALAAKNAPPKNGPPQTQTASDTNQSTDLRTQSTKNFELDKTVSHTKNQPGTIKRLSVAVLVDNRAVMDEKTKKMTKTPLTPKEIDQIKLLVADAIGLNIQRGDSLNVINTSFVKPDPVAAIPEERFWQKDIFWSIVKQAVAALFVLALIFGVLRPMLKTLASNRNEGKVESDEQPIGDLTYEGTISIKDANDYESQLNLLRQVVDKEPKRVAQVVKNWVDRG
ncbi:flagellar basal-body MS-ring/collar protein FliF [Fluoribacter gormanii]|uniref:Flagellar M-ring protein n=1 Tax=Fluoribacter gormanii TaxID=464 RepID=A0A377GJP0_9GAMM|nr:flagellar basal-body MS-ring/collar protein FliF [Fluoribacter gormanii]KTD03514.1 flagellar MS-ring protein [Fluoribacter gormanii]MCW8443898.1 flagellar basal-body MS-ring/collar protein FliF [Fluoribacter gormanii]MCW8469082.1 flagellar basal-body MS-ring/collar protein FliF [Fluoribacter gormanii]SIQ44999.1 flagellar M-ring protein FliF [Fluoribacter gormanii]STO24542.1 Flagellar M-ring protein [Fluoribacter gormanii]